MNHDGEWLTTRASPEEKGVQKAVVAGINTRYEVVLQELLGDG